MSSISGKPITITARFILPVDRPPLPGGSVTIESERIVAVEGHGARQADIDLGNAAVLPGFVNAHTHLDLTGMRGRTPPGPDFVAWLRAVIGFRREQAAGQVQSDIKAGLEECLASGVTLIGDIAGAGQSWEVLSKSACRSVVFYELLGLTKSRALQNWAAACDWLRRLPTLANCRPGISPHAPYSVRASLFRAACRLSQEQSLPLATHIAESGAEIELLSGRNGPMVQFLRDLGVYDPAGLFNSMDELVEFLGEFKRTFLVHGNYLGPSAESMRGKSVVYCPRTHHAFGHTAYPLAEFLRSGVRVALGTDSLASNPDLSIFNEVRFVRRHHVEVAPSDILRMATINGAEVLGRDRDTGDLTPGKSADLAIVALPDGQDANPELLVLDDSSSVSGVMIGGAWHVDPRKG